MKTKWIDEQLEIYGKMNIEEIKKKIVNDLKESIDFFETEDIDSAYRMAGGTVKAMFVNEENLR